MKLVTQSHVIRQPYTQNIKGAPGFITWDGWRDMLDNIDYAARTCYQSDMSRATRARFIRNLVKNGHHSVLEHGHITVEFTTDRGVSHELVRHRLASYSQESTRYCDYGGEVTFVIPSWFEHPLSEYQSLVDEDPTSAEFDGAELLWLEHMIAAEKAYQNLREHGCWTPQQARSVLPNSLKTSIVVTANPREWRHILELRTSPAAHPDIRALMLPLLSDFARLAPLLFGDIEDNLNNEREKEIK
jgi:thymidylate synthase (FAD)